MNVPEFGTHWPKAKTYQFTSAVTDLVATEDSSLTTGFYVASPGMLTPH